MDSTTKKDVREQLLIFVDLLFNAGVISAAQHGNLRRDVTLWIEKDEDNE